MLIFTISLLTCAERGILAQVLETQLVHLSQCIRIIDEQRLVIRSPEEFSRALAEEAAGREDCSEFLKKIDFQSRSLIGIGLTTGYCRTPVGLAFEVVKKSSEKIYELNIVYLEPRRKSCPVPGRFDLWLAVPKLPRDFDVRYSVKAVLPDK